MLYFIANDWSFVDMLADERKADIVRQLEQQQTVITSKLIKQYHVSTETIRRDLEQLESLGLLKRVHGGAVSLHKMKQFVDLDVRFKQNREKKQETAKAVFHLLKEDDCIALDTGSTAKEIALMLRESFQRMTVITASSEIFSILESKDMFHLIQIGGEYLKSEKAFYGYQSEKMLRELHVCKSILCPTAFSLHYGLSDNVPLLIPLQRILLEISDEIIIATDSSKLDTVAAYHICEIKPTFMLATDKSISAIQKKNIEEKGISITIGG